jgi:hypothetical protein
LTVAGSDKTATLLTAATFFFLLKNQSKLELLTKEIRASFAAPGLRITLRSTFGISVTLCQSGGLVTLDMRTIKGKFANLSVSVPGTVSVESKPTKSQSPSHSSHLHIMTPENNCRRVANAWIPCCLAYAEMRVILGKVIWNFDFELCKESELDE